MGYRKKAERVLKTGRNLLEKRSKKGKEGLKKRARKAMGAL